MSELEKVSSLIDSLTLQCLMLMEQFIDSKMNIETYMGDGEGYLAKARYIMGVTKVSALQIPTEDGQDHDAVATVESAEDENVYGQKLYSLNIQNKSINEEDDDNRHDPLKWFGVLVPQSLREAQTTYRKALGRCVQSVNIQTELRESCIKLEQLKEYKRKLIADR